jgi:hypothetical protein
MPSRKKRKRYRLQKPEATAKEPGSTIGWGNGYPTTRSDLVLLRHAINEDWPVAANVRTAIAKEIVDTHSATSDSRHHYSTGRVLLAMIEADTRMSRKSYLIQLLAKRLSAAK